MVNNSQIKRNIKRQIKGSFHSNVDLEELIESFLSFVQYPLNDSFANLDGIETYFFIVYDSFEFSIKLPPQSNVFIF